MGTLWRIVGMGFDIELSNILETNTCSEYKGDRVDVNRDSILANEPDTEKKL